MPLPAFARHDRSHFRRIKWGFQRLALVFSWIGGFAMVEKFEVQPKLPYFSQFPTY